MKLFYVLVVLIFSQNCSFDNKSGIWKDNNSSSQKNNDTFKDFKALSTSNKSFNKVIPLDKNYQFKLNNPINNFEWTDIYYDKSNNFNNFQYSNNNKNIFKSKKLSKYKISDYVLFEKNNLITSDEKGNIIVFSVNENKIIVKFNFYKKKYKNINKTLNFIIDKNIIYISDNIGYLYSYDYKNNKVLWAKNYKIPFRSNLKLFEDKLIASNQNNNLYFFNKNNGDILKLIPTEEVIVKNQFINNLSLSNESLLFLNTYGSLYSIDINSMAMKWFTNLNQTLDLNPSNLFLGNEIINNDKKAIVSSNNSTYIIDIKTGSIDFKKNIPSEVKSVIHNNYLFLISKNSFLTVININDGNILYSVDINESVANFFDTKKKEIQIKNMMLINNKIYIFLKNSYIIKLSIKGDIQEITKLSVKINSQPIIIDNSILYLNSKNGLSILN
jgi:outer membrane protein assembly factor BamB